MIRILALAIAATLVAAGGPSIVFQDDSQRNTPQEPQRFRFDTPTDHVDRNNATGNWVTHTPSGSYGCQTIVASGTVRCP